MTHQTRRPDEQRADQLAKLLREDAPPTTNLDAARERFLRTEVQPDRLSKRHVIAGLAAVVIGALAFSTMRHTPRHEPPLTYTTHDLETTRGTWTLQSAEHPGDLRFDDGSRVTLHRGRFGLSHVDDDGAFIELHEGHLSVSIQHRPDADWRVDTGGGTVFVTGTRFDVDWDANGVLEVELFEGSVRVELLGSAEPVHLSEGERLWANVVEGAHRIEPVLDPTPARDREGRATPNPPDEASPNTRPPGTVHVDAAAVAIADAISSARGAAERTPPPDAATAPRDAVRPPSSDTAPADNGQDAPHDEARTTERPAHDADAVERPVADVVDALSWPDAVERGDYTTVLDQAEADRERALDTRPLDDLIALSEAARYSRRRDIAYAAQRAMRDRFPESSAGRDAAFFLGRHHERERQWTEAAQWYATYLDESPTGAYATQALGRRMTVLNEAGQTDAARSLAATYLELDADGPFAAAATQLLEAP